VGAQSYRDAYFLCGSAYRLLAGKIPVKDYRTTLEDLWHWSKQKVDEIHHDASDVPNYPPPQAPVNGTQSESAQNTRNSGTELPQQPATQNGNPEPPKEPIVYITDEQFQRFVAHCRKQGFSVEGVTRFLKDHQIEGTNIPFSQARDLWNKVREPQVAQQYR